MNSDNNNSWDIISHKSFPEASIDKRDVDSEQTMDEISTKSIHPRHNWEKLFSTAQQDKGAKNDPLNELMNNFDREEWTW